MKTEVYDRFRDYNKDHCWQYDIRVQNRGKDLAEANLTEEDATGLRIPDFDFAYVDKTDRDGCKEVSDFIQRHEWLGKLPNRPTQRFTARYRKTGALAGVIVMATPNAFSKLIGPDTRDIEKLISRGACISWSPKNLGSWLVMKSITWMVENTPFRLFTAYSDPEAKELGTIYQACNFLYLGHTSGTMKQYFDPDNPKWGWFSDREFRKRGKYAKYAEKLGISKAVWKSYMGKWTPQWETMPSGLKEQIKDEERKYRESCQSREVPPKHKYCYIRGSNRKETKQLLRQFAELNPKLVDLPYPQARGEF